MEAWDAAGDGVAVVVGDRSFIKESDAAVSRDPYTTGGP